MAATSSSLRSLSGIVTSKPATISAPGSVIARVRYASSATTVEPSSSSTVDP